MAHRKSVPGGAAADISLLPPLQVLPTVRVAGVGTDGLAGAMQQLISACDNALSYCADVARWARDRAGIAATTDSTDVAMVLRDIDKTIGLLSDARTRLVRAAVPAGKPPVPLQ